MNKRMHSAMREATRLTNAGRLTEATAAIQQALQGTAMPEAADNARGYSENAPIEGSYRVLEPRRRFPNGGSNTPPHGSSEPPLRQRGPLHARWRQRSQWSTRSGPIMPERTPGASADPGQFLSKTYSNQAGTRDYKLYIPRAYHGQMLPLVIMLHGCTQNPDDFAIGTRMNQFAETTPCIVAYPAQARAANMSGCWNWFKPTDQQRDQGEPSIIAGITNVIAASYAIDRQRIYVAGLSAGGAMAAIMGAAYPDLYAAVGIHSGPDHTNAHDLPSAFAAMHGGGMAPKLRRSRNPDKNTVTAGIPNIVFHGDQDFTVRPDNPDTASTSWQQPQRNSSHGKETEATRCVNKQHGQIPHGHAYTRCCYQGTDGHTVAEHWLVHGAGHAWSGGSASGSYTDPRGPDATREMLRFFQEHPWRQR